MKLNELICAFGTAAGTAALAVLRISGEGAAEAADRIFRFGPLPKELNDNLAAVDYVAFSDKQAQTAKQQTKAKRTVKTLAGYQAAYGHIVDPVDQQLVDEVVLLRYKAPHSFTGEEMVEISCHGGVVSKERLLQAAIHAGCRLATPGEFSKRAFLNGKFSLVEAEGLADLLAAEARDAQELALSQLAGNLGARFKLLENKLLLFEARVQMAIEFPEYPEYDIDYTWYTATVSEIKQLLLELRNSYQRGKVAKEGLKVALLGAPNAGKSSLLNAFYGDERAIVTNIPGTTRDVLEADVNYRGLLIRLADTAGVRLSEDIVEQEGIKRSFKTALEADIVLWLLPSDSALQAGLETAALPDTQLLEQLKTKNISLFFVVSKADLSNNSIVPTELARLYAEQYPIYSISVYDEQSIDALLAVIYRYYENLASNSMSKALVSSLRQFEAISRIAEILDSLAAAQVTAVAAHLPPLDILDQMLQAALEELQILLGKRADEDLLNTIFSTFCVGK